MYMMVDSYSNTPEWAKATAKKVLTAEGIDAVKITWTPRRRNATKTGSYGDVSPFAVTPHIRIYAGTELVSQMDILIHELVHIVRERDRKYTYRHPFHDTQFYNILFYWQWRLGHIVYSFRNELLYKPRGARAAIANLGISPDKVPNVYLSDIYLSESTIYSRIKKKIPPYSEGWSSMNISIDYLYDLIGAR